MEASDRIRQSDSLSETQRDALWKWRWLGFRDSTPAFKSCLVLAAAILLALAAYAMTAMN
jgi:hypothetical protein